MNTTRTPVLVTGGNGFVGSHTVARLLADGHHVRTTVRGSEQAADLRSSLARAGVEEERRLEIVTASLDADTGWAEAAEGCAFVLHVASPFPAAQPDDPEEVIRPARDGTLRVLRAVRAAGARRVVLTSSFAAIGYSRAKDGPFDECDWTDPDDEANTPYVRSKAAAERAAWDFVAAEGAGLELVVVNPSGIFGPALSQRLSASVAIVKAMLEGAMPVVPPMAFNVVDVRDVADLQLRALDHPAAAGQRFLAGSEKPLGYLRLAEILADRLGERAARVPRRELTPGEVRAAAATDPAMREVASRLGQAPILDTRKARTLLGWTPRPAEETIADTAESLFALGLVTPA